MTPEYPICADADKLRPRVHFTPARNWMNDPNGLIHHDGEYHLFFQHNPGGTQWGDMSWGHAVSPDLVHWRELPVALWHDDVEQVFSGSVVVVDATLAAVYTSARRRDDRQAQALAVSTDRGRTFTKHAGNPVLDIGSTAFRDPKVWWHAPSGRWLMAVALAAEHAVALYASADLERWEPRGQARPEGRTDGVWECPDLFPLAAVGAPGDQRWVLVVSVGADVSDPGVYYSVGDFDGRRYDGTPLRRLDHGSDYFAAVSWEGLPERRVMAGWLGSWRDAEDPPTGRAWNGAASVPREVGLRRIDGELRLVQRPVRELDRLRDGTPTTLERTPLGSLPVMSGAALDITLELAPGSAARCGLRLHGGGGRCVVGLSPRSGEVYVERRFPGVPGGPARAPLAVQPGPISVRVLLDVSSVEVFAGAGEAVLTLRLPPDDAWWVEAFAEDGMAELLGLTAWPLRSYREATGDQPVR